MDRRAEWSDPAAFATAAEWSKQMPEPLEAMAAFFLGAAKSWELFLTEYTPEMDALTADEHRRSARPAANNRNEGKLAELRPSVLHAPNMANQQRNARWEMATNNTQDYIDTFDADNQQYLRKEARVVVASGIEKKRRDELAEHRADQARTWAAHEQAQARKAM